MEDDNDAALEEEEEGEAKEEDEAQDKEAAKGGDDEGGKGDEPNADVDDDVVMVEKGDVPPLATEDDDQPSANGYPNDEVLQETTDNQPADTEGECGEPGTEDDEEDYEDEDEEYEEKEAMEEDNEEEDGDAEEEEEEEEEQPTSLEEKQSLLTLAAEHDRVDILKAIFTENDQDRETLLHSNIPPLHIAVSFGSTGATNCLLRMGANPSIRPNVAEIQRTMQTSDSNDTSWARYDGLTAWELAFGKEEEGDGDNGNNSNDSGSGWFGSVLTPSRKTKAVNMPPSKREGIRHAFTTEALRCIGSDEVDRLKQLLDCGMPTDIDIGGKTLSGWCVEMGAKECQKLVSPEATTSEKEEEKGVKETRAIEAPATPSSVKKVVSVDSVEHLTNRLEELDSLASALSTCLDNLAEEVSVCHGLLLMGGGASALASHVRSLKEQLSRRQEEVRESSDKWERAEDLLRQWKRRVGEEAAKEVDDIVLPQPVSSRRLSYSREPVQLQAQIGATENKVRKLRASVTDMSEESEKALQEVEKRGLSGGITLVRKLREELRELEFQLSESKSGEAMCRAKIQRLQAKLTHPGDSAAPSVVVTAPTLPSMDREEGGGGDAQPKQDYLESPQAVTPELLNDPVPSMQNPSTPVVVARTLDLDAYADEPLAGNNNNIDNDNETTTIPLSEKVATGKSEAIMLRESGGYLSMDIWQILLRIIGLGRSAVRTNVQKMKESTTNVMIV